MTGYDSKRDAAAGKMQEPVDIASIIACREMLDAQPVPARTSVREALKLALEALESSRVFVTTREKIKHPEGTKWYDERITAIKAALAQPAQEPVAREWNFCERCGKRTKDLTVIHTCTPPQGAA